MNNVSFSFTCTVTGPYTLTLRQSWVPLTSRRFKNWLCSARRGGAREAGPDQIALGGRYPVDERSNLVDHSGEHKRVRLVLFRSEDIVVGGDLLVEPSAVRVARGSYVPHKRPPHLVSLRGVQSAVVVRRPRVYCPHCLQKVYLSRVARRPAVVATLLSLGA